MQLTPSLPHYQAGSAFFTTLENVTAFDTRFDFTIPQPNPPVADGLTFVLQSSPGGASALGPNGGGLRYGPDKPYKAPAISNSVAIKFDLSDNAGEGVDSTGLFVNGDSPSLPAHSIPAEPSVDMTGSGVDLHASGHTFQVHLTYDGTTLRQSVKDLTSGAMFTHAYAVNIPAFLGTAEVGLLRWTYVGTPNVITTIGANATVTLFRDSNGTSIDWSLNGQSLAAVPASASLTINSVGGSDTVMIDGTGGSPLPELLKLAGAFTLSGLNEFDSG